MNRSWRHWPVPLLTAAALRLAAGGAAQQAPDRAGRAGVAAGAAARHSGALAAGTWAARLPRALPSLPLPQPSSTPSHPPVAPSSTQECALIEQSVNSTRVSLRFRVQDGVEAYLKTTLLRFMLHRWAGLVMMAQCRTPRGVCCRATSGRAQGSALWPPPAWASLAAGALPHHPICGAPRRRADQLEIVRRAALPGWDVTFLVTNFHLDRYRREGLVAFVLQFVRDLHAEVSAMKLALRSRARAVVGGYWQELERRRGAAASGGAAGASSGGG